MRNICVINLVTVVVIFYVISVESSNVTRSTNKKHNATLKNKVPTTKGSLQKGDEKKDGEWPKIQKRRLRDKPYSSSASRYTKMNVMPLDDQTTKAQEKEIQEDSINRELNPYALLSQMTRIASMFTDANITLEVIGRTLEYNDIVLLKITEATKENAQLRSKDTKYVEDTDERKIIFIVHGLSVAGMIKINCLASEREFIQLVSYYLKHLDKFDIFLIPMANPDGYVNKNKNWNKNVSPQEACPGVALDRNFDVAWNITRNVNSCSQLYPGPAPFTEPETRAVRSVLHRYAHKIVSYIHVHPSTYNKGIFKGDAVLYPKGYTDVQTDDDKYIDLRGEIEEALRKANFQVYSVTVDTLYNWYGKVSGTSVDYASSVYGIPYCMEFAMQIYYDEEVMWLTSAEKRIDQLILVEVWQRVIDVVMNTIWNSLQSNEIDNK